MVTTESQEGASGVEALLLEALANADLPAMVENLLFAALAGSDPAQALAGVVAPRPLVADLGAAAPQPVKTYLKAVVVEGFRGIGTQSSLRLAAGPGLTLVIGRNGSGKSSFAEAAELALTGDNRRWAGRSSVWREGWRNLHHADPTRITVELVVDGVAGICTVEREWAAGADLLEPTAFVQQPGRPRAGLQSLGWATALDLYRPFLSYAELGALVDGKPSEMYDALQAILGLDQLLAMENLLATTRKALDELIKHVNAQLPTLLNLLAAHPDPRARAVEAALAARRPDLESIAVLAVTDDGTPDQSGTSLQRLASLTAPDRAHVEAAVTELHGAAAEAATADATPPGFARRLADLLRAALDHHADNPGKPCPVCGVRSLDDAWATHAREEVTRLEAEAASADAAHLRRRTAIEHVRALLGPEPAELCELLAAIDTGPAHASWQKWIDLTASPKLTEQTDEVLPAFDAVATATAAVRDAALAALARRSAAWQPAGTALAVWVEQARASQTAKAQLEVVKQAEGWLKIVGQQIRNHRLAPLATLSASVWHQLRQESNVDLGPIQLEGASTRRRVVLDVTVDGVPGAALGVMSQGELHALGLALFLPRATAEDSPFRFLLIDDPVQSMDPAKVDGLARVLMDVARTRQVVVFTHDDRLPEAVRRLQLPATVWEVTRRENSHVEVKKGNDPVRRCLDDARALAYATELPEDARAVVVAGFCRTAIEAACHARVRARQLDAGVPHTEVERQLVGAQTLHQLLALTLFNDPGRGEAVTGKLHELGGPDAVRAFKTAKSGTHEPYRGDLMAFIRDTERLAARLAA